MSVGKRMSVSVDVRTQDDLDPTAQFLRAMPPEQRAALDAALDLYGKIEAGEVIPAKALTSGNG